MSSASAVTSASNGGSRDPGDGTGVGAGVPDRSSRPPAPGELHIKEKRTWKTWQLLSAMVVAALIGMWLNYDSGGSSQAATTKSYALPPQAATGGAAPTTTAPSSVPTDSGGKTAPKSRAPSGATKGTTTASTTAAASSVTTTSAPGSGSPPTTAPGTPLQLLLPATQLHGNWTSPSFTTTAAPWNIGWAFRCTPAPTSGPSFQVFVAPSGGNPAATPAVNESGASGQAIATASSLGGQVLMVKSPANCVWVVKVTGN